MGQHSIWLSIVGQMMLFLVAALLLQTASAEREPQDHPKDVIVTYSDKCNAEGHLRSLRSKFPELSDEHAKVIEDSFSFTPRQLTVDMVREQNLKTLSRLLNPKAGELDAASDEVDWTKVSKRYFDEFGMEVITDPHKIVDSKGLTKIANYLPCLGLPAEPDRIYPFETFINEATTDHSEETRDLNDGWNSTGVVGRNLATMYPSDRLPTYDWHIKTVKLMEAWELFSGSTKGLDIAVVDTGCSFHPDLAPNLWIDPTNPKCKGADASHPTREPGCYGWDMSLDKDEKGPDSLPFYTRGNPLAETDVHGTGVAGMVAAVGNNEYAVPGVCWGCKIVCLKIVDNKGNFRSSAILDAYHFILKRGFKISNHSYSGFTETPDTLVQALKILADRNHLAVVSAGNTGCSVDGPLSSANTCNKRREYGDNSILFPGGVPHPNILTIGSTTITNGRSSFSNYGSRDVHLMAPGTKVRILQNTKKRVTALANGTSFSGPMVAGAAALVWGANPTLTAQQVKQRLISTSKKFGHLRNFCTSSGVLDVYEALKGSPVSDPPKTAPKPTKDFTDFFYYGLQQDGASNFGSFSHLWCLIFFAAFAVFV